MTSAESTVGLQVCDSGMCDSQPLKEGQRYMRPSRRKDRVSGISGAVKGSIAAVMATAMLAFVGSAAAAGGSRAAANAKKTETLTVAVGTTQTDMMSYIAQQLGYFKKQGVDVKILDNTLTTTSALVISGRADVAAFALIAPVAVANQGKPTSIIFGSYGGGAGGSMMVKAGGPVSTADDLKTLSSCKIATFPAGSVSYGYTAVYVHQLNRRCSIVQLADFKSQLAQLLDGTVQAVVGAAPLVVTPALQSQVSIVINTLNTADRETYLGPRIQDTPDVGFWGAKDHLAKKRAAVVRFLAAVEQARAFILAHSRAKIAEVLDGVPVYAAIPPAQLLSGISWFKARLTVGNTAGVISKKEWGGDQLIFPLFGIPGLDPKVYRYANMIDMSFAQQAEQSLKHKKKKK